MLKNHWTAAILVYDVISGHAEGVIHEVVHHAGISAIAATELSEGQGVAGVPIGFGKDGNDVVCFHKDKEDKKRKKKQTFPLD